MHRCPFLAARSLDPNSSGDLEKYANFHAFLEKSHKDSSGVPKESGRSNDDSSAPKADGVTNVTYSSQTVLPFNLTGNILKAQDEIMNHGPRGAYATFYLEYPDKAPSGSPLYSKALLDPPKLKGIYSAVSTISKNATTVLRERVKLHRLASLDDESSFTKADEVHVSIVLGFGVQYLESYCKAYDLPLPYALIRDAEKKENFARKRKEIPLQLLELEEKRATGQLGGSTLEAQIEYGKLSLQYSDDACNSGLIEEGEKSDQRLYICQYYDEVAGEEAKTNDNGQGRAFPPITLGRKLKVMYNTPYANTRGDMWFQIKLLNCPDYEDVDLLLDIVMRLDRLMQDYKIGLCVKCDTPEETYLSRELLSKIPDKDTLARRLNSQNGLDTCMPRNPILRIGASRNDPTDPKVGGKILGCRFAENLNTVVDDTSLLDAVLIGEEDPQYMGASFAFVQSFEFDWSKILSRSETDLENAVGRKQDDEIIPYSVSHENSIISARSMLFFEHIGDIDHTQAHIVVYSSFLLSLHRTPTHMCAALAWMVATDTPLS